MDEILENKAVLALIGVVVGWLLGQGTALVSTWIRRARLRRGLLKELESIDDDLLRLKEIHARQMQFAANDMVEPDAALPIAHYYFETSFREIYPFLSRAERMSYPNIHAHVDAINNAEKLLADFTRSELVAWDRIEAGARKRELLERWRAQVCGLYESVRMLQWHVVHHLQNKERPGLQLYDEGHEAFARYAETISEEMQGIVNDAKKISLVELKGRGRYDAAQFAAAKAQFERNTRGA